MVKKTGRRPEIIYDDVTNFCLQIEESDDDEMDENGEVIEKGLRKMALMLRGL